MQGADQLRCPVHRIRCRAEHTGHLQPGNHPRQKVLDRAEKPPDRAQRAHHLQLLHPNQSEAHGRTAGSERGRMRGISLPDGECQHVDGEDGPSGRNHPLLVQEGRFGDPQRLGLWTERTDESGEQDLPPDQQGRVHQQRNAGPECHERVVVVKKRDRSKFTFVLGLTGTVVLHCTLI